MSKLRDGIGVTLAMIVSLPLTIGFFAWIFFLPTIGALWLMGWLK